MPQAHQCGDGQVAGAKGAEGLANKITQAYCNKAKTPAYQVRSRHAPIMQAVTTEADNTVHYNNKLQGFSTSHQLLQSGVEDLMILTLASS